jgi:hypothetical protein
VIGASLVRAWFDPLEAVLLNQRLSGSIPARSLRNKDLSVKYLLINKLAIIVGLYRARSLKNNDLHVSSSKIWR